MKRTFIVSVVAVAVLSGCSSQTESEGQATPPQAPSTTTQASGILTTNLADCRKAEPAQTQLIAAALSSGLTLGPAFVETSPDGDVYVGANIMRGEERVSSADVWVLRNNAPFALSSDARSRTTLADGRKLVDSRKVKLSAGDQHGTKVQGCVVAQARKDNGK